MAEKFPLRAIILGALLSVLVALYSAYAGLKVGGVYWPMVTTAVACMALAKLLGGRSIHETNVMQTTASTGGLLAAGIIFTIPAAFMLGFEISASDIVLVGISGGLLALIFIYPLRQQMIVKEKLPYPDGTAAASILKAGDSAGVKRKRLFAAFGAGAAFAVARDVFSLFPSYINLESLKASASKLFSLGSSISLIPLAGGYLIGARFTFIWFLGAVASYFLAIPYFVSAGFFADKAGVISAITRPVGAGMVMGAAIAYFALVGLPAFKSLFSYYKSTPLGRKSTFILVLFAVILAYAFDLSFPLALLAIAGAFLMSYVGARITGEMNIDPMELFALILLLAAKYLFGFGAIHLVLLAAVVCVAAGIAGDAMQDFKTGHLLGTNPMHQLAGEAAGVLSASLVMGATMLSFASVGFGTMDFPAPQATAIKEIVHSEGMPLALEIGILLGVALTFAAAKLNLPSAPIAFGIGLYVPIELSLPLFAGGILRFLADKAGQTEKWRLVAGGVIAGEGLVGALLVLLAAAKFLGA
ncbi:MAG: OPT/YSL family transporter [Candidatus Micrarchaeota archaeon]|nr:OPT/YSL family transporter [Candidatus Micrarchaeota archaeon]